MMKYRILNAALDELEQASLYYESKSDGLGDEFLLEFKRTMRLIAHNPSIWRFIAPDHRKTSMDRFPYAIIYSANEEEMIEVVSVFHLKREPLSWLENLESD